MRLKLDTFYELMFRELEDNNYQQDIKDGARMFQLVLFADPTSCEFHPHSSTTCSLYRVLTQT